MGLGEQVRKLISEKINEPINSRKEKVKNTIKKIREGGGSEELKRAQSQIEKINKLQEVQQQFENYFNQAKTLISASTALQKTAEALKEANSIGSALNPAAAAIAIVQEKLVAKFKEEIEDVKSAADGIGPALNNLKKSIIQMKDDLNQAIKDRKKSDEVKAERDAQLGK